MIPALIKLAPIAIRVVKVIVVVAPHVLAAYQQHKGTMVPGNKSKPKYGKQYRR